MTDRHDGGPAFPVDDIIQLDEKGQKFGAPISSAGMTLRDWFAGQAINGLCADPTNHKLFDDMHDAAANAYLIADAMIAARSEAKP